eukprot:720047-Prorocentrum_lima.AAC.1
MTTLPGRHPIPGKVSLFGGCGGGGKRTRARTYLSLSTHVSMPSECSSLLRKTQPCEGHVKWCRKASGLQSDVVDTNFRNVPGSV